MHAPERDTQADLASNWYFFAWAEQAPSPPVFHVLDTESSLGPYAVQTKAITMKDLVKFHGHLCDGLVVASVAFQLGFSSLYPEGVIDRTDTGVITNNSPCFGDAAAYLSGGRIRFGTQKIDPELKMVFIVHRFSTGETVRVALNPGVFPAEVAEIEGRIRTGSFMPDDIDECLSGCNGTLRDTCLRYPAHEVFTVERVPDFEWTPDAYSCCGKRGDVVCKHVGKRR